MRKTMPTMTLITLIKRNKIPVHKLKIKSIRCKILNSYLQTVSDLPNNHLILIIISDSMILT